MFNTDDYWKNIEKRMSINLSTFGETERSMSQHLGHMVNNNYIGNSLDTMLGNIDRTLSGLKKHGFEQNKKTELEKLQEKGNVNDR